MKPGYLAILFLAAALAPALAEGPALAGEPKLSQKTPAFLCLKSIGTIDDVMVDACSPLTSYKFGMKAMIEEGGSGGAGPPEVETTRMEVSKTFDTRTAQFFNSLITGANLQDLELAISLEDGRVIKFTFAQGVVREMSFEGGDDGGPLVEHVVFELGSFVVKFDPIATK